MAGGLSIVSFFIIIPAFSMNILQLLFYFFIIIPSAILHEYAHGAIADWLGDPTARYAGRLSLNPRVHIDLWGTILMPLLLFTASGGNFFFAYAKPVPYNPYNLKNQRWGPVAVAVAGPLSNFFLAWAFGIVMRLFPPGALSTFLSIIVYSNILLGVFNLVPIPPLDGSKILAAILPSSWMPIQRTFERYGIIVLFIFVFYFFHWLEPVIRLLYRFFAGAGASLLY